MAAKKGDLAAVVGDTRLSADARIIVLHVAFMGKGEHELGYAELTRLLNQAGEKRVRRAVRDAHEVGWLTVRWGGRHCPRFTFNPANSAGLDERETLPEEQGQIFDPAEVAGLNGAGPLARGFVEPSTTDDAVDDIPPVVPPFASVAPDAEAAIVASGDQLRGCRGSLRDYLVRCVPSRRQYGYVQVVRAWRDGAGNVFRRPDGSTVPPTEQNAVLAEALNDLSASDEAKMKRPVGDPANLRTKINVLLKAPLEAGASNGKHMDPNERVMAHFSRLDKIDLNASRSSLYDRSS